MPELADIDTLKSELLSLRQMAQRIEQEINAINQATEKATHTIIGAAEQSDENIATFRSFISNNADAEILLSAMTASTQKIYEACAFQDITSQRAGKIIESLGYIEERIISIAELLDGDTYKSTMTTLSNKTKGDKLLEGPQHEGKGLMQSDIDAQFD
jgi:chemotaxis protein CheZ